MNTDINDKQFNSFFYNGNSSFLFNNKESYITNDQFNFFINEENEINLNFLYDILVPSFQIETEVEEVKVVTNEVPYKEVEEMKVVENKVPYKEVEIKEVEKEMKVVQVKLGDILNEVPYKEVNYSNTLYFKDIFKMDTYLDNNISQLKYDMESMLEYEVGKFTLNEHMSKLKCIKLNKNNNSYGIYVVDLLYPIVFYSGNVARSLKYLKETKQIIMVENMYNKRVITLEGCLNLFSILKSTKKSRNENVFQYMTLVENLIYNKYPDINNNSVLYTNTSTTTSKKSYTTWMKYYSELKKYLSTTVSSNTNYNKDNKLTFPPGYKNNKLINWCILQKSNKNRGILTEKKINLLNSLNSWHWGTYRSIDNPKSKLKWDHSFEQLKIYLNEINNEPLYFKPNSTYQIRKLYKWCISQKTNAKRGLISDDKIEKLNSLEGWHWNNLRKVN